MFKANKHISKTCYDVINQLAINFVKSYLITEFGVYWI